MGWIERSEGETVRMMRMVGKVEGKNGEMYFLSKPFPPFKPFQPLPNPFNSKEFLTLR
jgi:hypothetical protein